MLDRMKALASQKNICVMATVSGSAPYCSLMAYAVSEDCREIYLATLRATRKFRNLTANPSVSLLIDSREIRPRTQAQALTVEGTCHAIEDDAAKINARGRLLESHPHLMELLDNPDAALLCVRVKSFLLLEGLAEAHRVVL